MSLRPLRDQGDPTRRFSDKADAYDRHRPAYPPEAVDAVLQGLGDPASIVLADVGAGTGISSRLFAQRAVRVHAIEPNAAMRAAGKARGAGVEWHDGTGETTGLPDASVDVVVCAQSYHWLDPTKAATEFRRILTPGGRIALMWYDADERAPTGKAYEDVLRAHCPDRPLYHQDCEPEVGPGLRIVQKLRFTHTQRLDADGFAGRALSTSYVPAEGPVHDAVVRDLRAAHARHAAPDGLADLVYDVWVYLVGPPEMAPDSGAR